jgi:heptosyltransferase-2
VTSASTTSSESLPRPGRIWVRAPNWVGDVLMSTPALRALRRAQPQAEIVLSGRPWVGELLAGIGSFDRFVDEPRRHFRATLAHAVALRREGFDWAVLFPDSVRVALAPFLARIPLRIGYARNALRRALLTRVLAPPRTPEGARRPVSMIERYLDVVRPLGCTDAGHELDLLVSPSAAEQVAARASGGRACWSFAPAHTTEPASSGPRSTSRAPVICCPSEASIPSWLPGRERPRSRERSRRP